MKSDTDLDLVFKNAIGKKLVEAVEGCLRTVTRDVVAE